ncbi:MAG: tetratricopeptide repeat protein [Bacteroidales bacterium]|nr:tetratricopeptide repeat protein [Bacteroidales bacterium]MBR2856328.1 tetratricopeptide repeat protein [Bacteroidales bacterium]
MKKIFLLIAAALMAAGVASAQDINQATESYNNGAMELQNGNPEAALTHFQSALEMGESLGEEATDLVANCKGIIPQVMLSVAKGYIKDGDFAGALTQLDATIAEANKYENAEVAAEAAEFIPQVYMQQGNTALKAKDMATAATAYSKVVELDPANGNAMLRLGQVYAATGKTDEAVAAFENAAANGQETAAKKQLSNLFLKKAQAAMKGGKSQEAIDLCVKSNEYLENANAYKIAASCAQKLGKNDDVIAFYDKYLELSPKAKDAGGVAFTIAALYQQAGNKEKAKEYYQKASTDPQFGAAAQEQLKNL